MDVQEPRSEGLGDGVAADRGSNGGSNRDSTPGTDSVLPIVLPTEPMSLPAEVALSAEPGAVVESLGGQGAVIVLGQAGAAEVLTEPGAGQVISIPARPGANYVVEFDPTAARVSTQGRDLILDFGQDGGGRIVFSDFADAIGQGGGPSFQIGGQTLAGQLIYGQALALNDPDLDLVVAAGPGAQGSGASAYDDNLGNIIDLLLGQGVIGATTAESDVPVIPEVDIVDEETLLLAGAAVGPEVIGVPPTLLINEVGVSAALDVPAPPDDDSTGAGPAPVILADVAMLYDFVELLNNTEADTQTFETTLEILNPAGTVVTLDLPDGVTIPAGGFLGLYQDAAAGEGGDATVIGRVFDASGVVVDGFEIADAAPWLLGDDTAAPIAVNLISGDGDALDTFAANLTTAELGVLTAPVWTPNTLVPDNLDLSLDTFGGRFTGDHQVFSRVFDERDPASAAPIDSDSEADWTTNTIPTDGALNTLDGSEGATRDPNPADPLRDDLNPGQANPSPLAGQTVLAAAAGGALLEGGAGPDFLFGAAGDDTLYGGTEDLTDQQKAAAELGSALDTQDHNDFLSGDAGADALFGGSGGDYLIGGAGQDSLDGGTGNDRLFGYVAPIGGVDEDFDPGIGRSTEADLIAGDTLGRFDGDSPGIVTAGQLGGAGDDTIDGGLGDDLIAGEALASALGVASAAVANSDDEDPEVPTGNDFADGFDGFDTIAGEALAVADFGFASASVQNTADYGGAVGSDTLRGLGARDVIAGEAFSSSAGDSNSLTVVNRATDGAAGSDSLEGNSGYNVIAGEGIQSGGRIAGAATTNEAVGATAAAGNDTITATEGNDTLVGELLSFRGPSFDSVAENLSEDGGTAGNDLIRGGDGNNKISGDFAGMDATRFVGDSLASNQASGGSSGSDTISSGAGRDVIAGDSLGMAPFGGADAVNAALGAEARAGNDRISDGGGGDRTAGDALASGSEGAAGTAVNTGEEGGSAGADTISGGAGADTVAGDVLAVTAQGPASAAGENTALGGVAGGNTILVGSGADLVSGGSLAFSSAEATAYGANRAEGDGSAAGDDSIRGLDGFDSIAGDALARGGEMASATAISDASDGGSAGDDTISGDGAADVLSGNAMALAPAGTPTANAMNAADGGTAGSDVVSGRGGNNLIAGDALVEGGLGGSAEAENTAQADGAAGSDRLVSGDGRDTIAGDALARGGAAARVANTSAAVAALAGSDIIVSAQGQDVISGDALALDGGSAEVVNDGPAAGDDSISSGGSRDSIAGDALSDGGLASVTEGGDDTIDGGAGDDLIAGDALALDGGVAEVSGGGDDLIRGGGGSDTVFGDSSGDDTLGGDDTIYGDGGDDVLIGDSGDDLLLGGDDDDTLAGGFGDDTLTGGAGTDSFLFGGVEDPAGEGDDIVTDFSSSDDRLIFAGVTDQDSDTDVDLDDLLNSIASVVDAGAGNDVTVSLTNGSSVTFLGAGTGSIASIEDLVNDPSAQIIVIT